MNCARRLAAVSGFIETLRGHAKDDEVARDHFLDIMGAETARMRRLIDDLLSLTRIELNEHVQPEGRIGLEGVVREAVAALEPLARAGRGLRSRSTPGQPAPVIGDRDELIQLFQNLIHNAIKYGREGGHVGSILTPGRRPRSLLRCAMTEKGFPPPPCPGLPSASTGWT